MVKDGWVSFSVENVLGVNVHSNIIHINDNVLLDALMSNQVGYV